MGKASRSVSQKSPLEPPHYQNLAMQTHNIRLSRSQVTKKPHSVGKTMGQMNSVAKYPLTPAHTIFLAVNMS